MRRTNIGHPVAVAIKVFEDFMPEHCGIVARLMMATYIHLVNYTGTLQESVDEGSILVTGDSQCYFEQNSKHFKLKP